MIAAPLRAAARQKALGHQAKGSGRLGQGGLRLVARGDPQRDLYTSRTYSAAIKSGDLLFVSGQVGSRSDGSPEPQLEAQVRLAFANLEATLKAGGCTLDDIVDVTTFHTDPERQFDTIMAVKGEVFPKAPYPNWTALGVNWLAGFDFEIKVIARIPGTATR